VCYGGFYWLFKASGVYIENGDELGVSEA